MRDLRAQKINMNCFDIGDAKAVFSDGGNVTEYLRSKTDSRTNSSNIIEIAYDLQAGSYIEGVKANSEKLTAYTAELSSILSPYISSDMSLLDVGTGELTTLAFLMKRGALRPSDIYAFDISWSRLYRGLSFWNETVGEDNFNLRPFVADIKDIPLRSKSIDVITSSHALEPNGGSLPLLLRELFRICRGHLILFEPSYELNSEAGKARMDKLGYIKDIEGAVTALGGTLKDTIPLENVANPLNPTVCFVIQPPPTEDDYQQSLGGDAIFSVPGSDFPLKPSNGFMVSAEAGLVFPILKGIPVLKASSAILATSLF